MWHQMVTLVLGVGWWQVVNNRLMSLSFCKEASPEGEANAINSLLFKNDVPVFLSFLSLLKKCDCPELQSSVRLHQAQPCFPHSSCCGGILSPLQRQSPNSFCCAIFANIKLIWWNIVLVSSVVVSTSWSLRGLPTKPAYPGTRVTGKVHSSPNFYFVM